MADKFEFTENSARSVVNATLEGVKTQQRIEDAVAAGAKPLEVAEAALGTPEDIQDLGKQIGIVNLFLRLGEFYELADPTEQAQDNPLENLAFLGYAACMQHFVDSKPAIRFCEFFNAAQTNGDVLRYFLQENGLNDEDIRFHADYEHAFFQEWKQMQISPRFALNRSSYDAQIAAAEREHSETEEKLNQEGKL
jgi:hypothetical protein